MNAIEIRNLTKTFGEKRAVDSLNMTVPQGAIYGFIGENGSGKSTTEKLICGLIRPSGGEIKLWGKDHRDHGVRSQIGVLIEAPGCFSNYTVWNNMKLQAANLGLKNEDEEIRRVLHLVRMDGAASNKFKNCSLGMKQRIGIAFALLGDPALLVLDEPINGLDADGMRIMREILTDLAKRGTTVLISSHILGELEKIATHYGIIRQGKMVKEIAASEMDSRSQVYVSLKTSDMRSAAELLLQSGCNVKFEENEMRVYDVDDTARLSAYLLQNGFAPSELKKHKIGLEEYYVSLMSGKEAV